MVEANPTPAEIGRLAPVYMGIPSSFEPAGFVECARLSAGKAVMRITVG